MHFYDPSRMLSYNIPVNILIGERGVGKSFWAKTYVVDRYLKHNEHFLYIRRYENEISSIFTNNLSKDFFNDIKKLDKYKNLNLRAKKRKFYLDKYEFGEAKRLTEAQDLKSTIHEDVKTIIFDEYPIEKNRRYYLPNEAMIILGLFDSIIRNRSDIKIFILGNATERR